MGIYTLISDDVLELNISVDCYTREAVTAAAYALPPGYTAVLLSKNEKKWTVHIGLDSDDIDSDDTPGRDLIKTGEGFLRSLNDFQLREDLERRTGKIRDIIVERAFSPIKKMGADGNR